MDDRKHTRQNRNEEDNSNRRYYTPPPKEGSIHIGTCQRVEPYGAFISCSGFRGLVHISQLAPYKIESVEDAIAVNDQVYVKVLEVEEDESSERPRFRIRLSMKYVSQDNGEDLDPENREMMEEKSKRDARREGGGGSRRDEPSGLAMAQGSSDPMAIVQYYNRTKKMTLRGNTIDTATPQNRDGTATSSQQPMLFNGYALVGDDDDDDDDVVEKTTTKNTNPSIHLSQPPPPSMGRGRGMTLPAWMTQSKENGPSRPDRSPSDASSSSSHSRRKRHRHRSHRKHSRSSRKRHREDDHDRHDYDDRRRRRRSEHSKKKRRHHRHDRKRNERKHRRRRSSGSESSRSHS